MRASRWLVLLVGLGALASACSDDSVAAYNPADLSVETEVAELVVAPSDAFDVTCIVTHVVDGVVPLETLVTVSPADAADVEDHRVTARKVGTLKVACALVMSPDVVDPTPSVVLVTEGGAASVETSLVPDAIAAGETSTVECIAKNPDGQTVTAPTTVAIVQTEGYALADHTITGEMVGTYDVACQLVDLPTVRDESPSKLTVTAGPPAKVTTKLDATTVAAGGTMTVICVVEDAYGNLITGTTTNVDSSPADGVTISDHTLSAGKVGVYDITCHVDGKADVSEVPAGLEVTGGKPVSVVLSVDPVKSGYSVGDEVAFTWVVSDAFGNELDVPATFTAPTSGVKDLGGHSYALETEGAFPFTVELDAPNAGIEDGMTLLVDATGPKIIITYPDRGQTLSGDKAVTVTGKVTDAVSGVKQLTVNGGIVTPAADGSFSFTLQAAHGLNPVLAEATDVAGNAGKATVAFYFSTDYMPYKDTTADDVALDQSLRMFLGQDAIDDGNHDPAHVDDLATLVEILIANVDLTQLGIGTVFEQKIPVLDQVLTSITVPVINQTMEIKLTGTAVITVTVSDVTLSSKPTINLQSIGGGVHLTGELPKVNGEPGLNITLVIGVGFDLSVGGTVLGQFVGATLTPTLQSDTFATIDDVSFDTVINISKAAGSPLSVSTSGIAPKMSGIAIQPMQNAEIALGDVTLVMPFGIPNVSVPLGSIPLDWLLGDLGNLLGDFATPLLDTLLPLLGQFLGPVIDGPASDAIKAALESVQIDQDLDLPSLLGNAGAAINLKAALSTVGFKPSGGTLGLETGAWSGQAVDYEPLGSLLRDQCMLSDPGPFAFTEAHPMSIGLHMDLLNELLHAVWWNGYFDIAAKAEDLAALSPDIASYGVQDLTVTFLLPPVLTDCNNKGLLRFQLGDGFVTAKLNMFGMDIEAEMFLSVEMDANIKAQGNELGITINGVTLFQVEIVKVNEDLAGSEADLEETIKALLLPEIEKLTGDSLGSFPIPSIDLSGVVPGVPAGTSIQIGDLAVGKTKGFLVLEGDLQ